MRLLIIAALLLVAGPAWAEWVKVAEDEDDRVFFVDPAAIRRDGHLRRFWQLIDLKAPDKNGDLSYRAFSEADCKERRFRAIQQESFRGPMAKGEITGYHRNPLNWIYSPPGTVVEAVLEFVCSR